MLPASCCTVPRKREPLPVSRSPTPARIVANSGAMIPPSPTPSTPIGPARASPPGGVPRPATAATAAPAAPPAEARGEAQGGQGAGHVAGGDRGQHEPGLQGAVTQGVLGVERQHEHDPGGGREER